MISKVFGRDAEGANTTENPSDGDEGAEMGALPFNGEAAREVRENGTGIVDSLELGRGR